MYYVVTDLSHDQCMVGVPLPVPGSLLVEEPDVGHPQEAVQEPNHHLCILELYTKFRENFTMFGEGLPPLGSSLFALLK